MGTFSDRIAQLRDSFTPSEVKVAEYCLRHPEAIMGNSIKDVADKAGVSIASVSRMASTLGYKDWKDMRLGLAKDPAAADNPIFPAIRREDSEEGVIEKIFDSTIHCLRTTLNQLDKGQVLRLVRAIDKTDRIVFFGSGGFGYLALDEALRFSHLRLSAEAYTDDYQMMMQASKMKKGQIAFGFSNSGRTRATVNVLAEARRRGVLTVGIANFRHTPLEDASDIFLMTASPLGGDITASLTARASLVSIMDAIYVLAANRGNISEDVVYIDKVTETNLRLPPRRKPGKGR